MCQCLSPHLTNYIPYQRFHREGIKYWKITALLLLLGVMPHSLFAVFNMKLHMYAWKKIICGSEYVGLDILGQSNEDKTVSQKTDWCMHQYKHQQIYGASSNVVRIRCVQSINWIHFLVAMILFVVFASFFPVVFIWFSKLLLFSMRLTAKTLNRSI